jgi:type I restriction enzyme, S subunit
MKLETFFEKFELVTDAPNAVPRMRQMIFSLAVQGKLVSQEPSDDQHANTFGEQADSRRTNRTKSNCVTDCDELTTMNPVFELPGKWKWLPFRSLVIRASVGLDRGRSAQGADKAFGYFKMNNIRNAGGMDLSSLARIDATADEVEAFALAEGDFLFNTRNSKELVGKTCVYRSPLTDIVLYNNNILRAKFIEAASQDFVDIWFRSPQGMSELEKLKSNTTNVSAIYQGKLFGFPCPLPPLAEQKRIVAKVDELMALCDSLEEQQKQRQTQHTNLARASLARFTESPTPKNLGYLFHKSYDISPADLRKTILTLAVQGKLIPQSPKDEPASNLLARCLAERQRLKRTSATAVEILGDEDTLGFGIPKSWQWAKLDDLLIFGPTNGFSPKAVDFETPVRSLTLSATTSGTFKGKHSKFITTEVPPDSDLWLQDGDILVQRGNTIEYVGVPAVYRGEPNRFVYPDLMMKLRVSSSIDSGYIHLAMSQEAARDFLRARASGTSGSMPKINQTTLRSLPLPIPPLPEQRRIVAKVNELMTLVDQLESQLEQSKSLGEKLMEAIVAELTAAEQTAVS